VSRIAITVPDLGNFKDVPIIDVLVKPGEPVEMDTPLITLETEKATMDVPSSAAGTIAEILVKKGDKVSAGSVIVQLEPADTAGAASPAVPVAPNAQTSSPAQPAQAERQSEAAEVARTASPAPAMLEEPADASTQLLVLGAGPGG